MVIQNLDRTWRTAVVDASAFLAVFGMVVTLTFDIWLHFAQVK